MVPMMRAAQHVRSQPHVSTWLLATCLCMICHATSRAGEPELDQYGGWTDVKGQATGWFHIERLNGRDLLVTPDGHGFLPLGVNHLGAIRKAGKNEPDLLAERYSGNLDEFADEIARQYAKWGLNTVDDTVAPLMRRFPYLASRNFVKTAKYYTGPDGENPHDFPDVFDPAFADRIEQEAAAFCRKHRDNKNLIAYYWTDTPTWDLHKTRRFRQTDWVSEIRRLSTDSPGWQVYVSFLRKQYDNDIARFNRAYDLKVDGFDALTPDDVSSLDLTRYEIARDDGTFLGLIARTYYGIIGPAFRKYDPNHLVFGEKYLLGDLPLPVLAAATPHLDAIAIQPGDGYIPIYTPGDVYPEEEITPIVKASGKPVFICDHQVSFATERYPKSIWPYHQRPNEAEAAQATERFLLDAFSRPYLLGYMRCQYIDRYDERRGASKLGLVRDNGIPHADLVAATRRGGEAARRIVRDAVLQNSAHWRKGESPSKP